MANPKIIATIFLLVFIILFWSMALKSHRKAEVMMACVAKGILIGCLLNLWL